MIENNGPTASSLSQPTSADCQSIVPIESRVIDLVKKPLTLEEIFAEFPPKIEMMDWVNHNASVIMKVSRVTLKDNVEIIDRVPGAVLYMASPSDEDFKKLPLKTMAPISK